MSVNICTTKATVCSHPLGLHLIISWQELKTSLHTSRFDDQSRLHSHVLLTSQGAHSFRMWKAMLEHFCNCFILICAFLLLLLTTTKYYWYLTYDSPQGWFPRLGRIEQGMIMYDHSLCTADWLVPLPLQYNRFLQTFMHRSHNSQWQ